MKRTFSLVWFPACEGFVVASKNAKDRGKKEKTARTLYISASLALSATLMPVLALADVSNWATWTLPNTYPYTTSRVGSDPNYQDSGYAAGAVGSVINPQGGTVNLTLSGEVNSNSQKAYNGYYGFSYVEGGVSSSTAFITATSPTSPVGADYLVQTGYTTSQYKAHTLAFSQSVSNAVMALSSLGSPPVASTLTFSQPFVILSGNGNVTSGGHSLFSSGGDASSGYTLTGWEGSGVIQFLGTYSSISWNVSAPEYYSFYNFALTTASNLSASDPSITPYIFPSGTLPPIFSTTPDIVSGNNGQTGYNTLTTVNSGNYNLRFDGGTLVADSGTSTSPTATNANFTIVSGANKAFIDQSGHYAVFAGTISDDVANSPGRLIIENGNGSMTTGKITLTNINNSYSGGTEVRAGATLSIADPRVLGSGGIDLIGSITMPSTLETTATMTLSAPITVSGDPVFNVAPGTVLTVSSPIADGASAGDVVVADGGTLNLTAANTYTGATTIDAGSTLMLTGNSASISTSSAVTNSGTLDLRNADATTVTLGGTYTQGAAGTLRMVASAPGSFQKMIVAGSATLGGTLEMTAANGTYAVGRYTLIDAAGGRSGTFSNFSSNLASVTPLGFMLGYDVNQVYLYLTPGVDDTLQQINQNASGLRSLINAQSAVLQAGLTYDCTVFNKNNICVSAGGRYTYLGEDAASNWGGLLIIGYRPTSNTRIGVFADKSMDINGPAGIRQSKNMPTMGLFGNWALNQDGTGVNVHASAVFSSSDLTITRTASMTTEEGKGKSSFDGQAYELRANYVKPLTNTLTAIPYIGLRYTRLNNDAYTETAGSQVIWPISYSEMAQRTFSAVAGADFLLALADKLTGVAGLGMQQNLSYKMDAYSGSSGIPGLSSFSVSMTGKTATRGTANAGLFYSVSPTERLAVNALWQQLPSYHKGAISVMATWTMGF